MKTWSILCLVFGVVGGIYGQWGFGHQMCAIGITAYLLFPSFCIIGLIALISWARLQPRDWILPTVQVLLAIVASLMISYAVGVRIHKWQYDQVIEYVAKAHPALETMRAKSGVFPNTLPPELIADLPTWLRKPGAYTSYGDRFAFSYSDPAAMMFGGQSYESETRTWHNED